MIKRSLKSHYYTDVNFDFWYLCHAHKAVKSYVQALQLIRSIPMAIPSLNICAVAQLAFTTTILAAVLLCLFKAFQWHHRLFMHSGCK